MGRPTPVAQAASRRANSDFEATVRTVEPASRPRKATLTHQEIQSAYLAHYDLSAGYPQVPVPVNLANLYLDNAIEESSLKFAPIWTPQKQSLLNEDLIEAVRGFLSVAPGSHASIHHTFSGSVALDRALAAAVMMVSPTRSERVTVVTTSPSIDIMKLFLEERRFIDISFVESRATHPWGLDLDGVLERIELFSRKRSQTRLIVLLTSPENPTGQWWRREQLQKIAERSQEAGAVVIIDHAFLMVGVQDPGEVSTAWDALGSGVDWIAVWDTGKTFGLNEDKLGFIISGSEAANLAVEKSLGIMQFDVARRQKLFFATLLRKTVYLDYVVNLRNICRANLMTMEECIRDSSFKVIHPEAGSLALLRIPTRNGDERSRKHLLTHGVGVITGSVFFHTGWSRNDILRIALARDPVYFREGFNKLMTEIVSLF